MISNFQSTVGAEHMQEAHSPKNERVCLCDLAGVEVDYLRRSLASPRFFFAFALRTPAAAFDAFCGNSCRFAMPFPHSRRLLLVLFPVVER